MKPSCKREINCAKIEVQVFSFEGLGIRVKCKVFGTYWLEVLVSVFLKFPRTSDCMSP